MPRLAQRLSLKGTGTVLAVLVILLTACCGQESLEERIQREQAPWQPTKELKDSIAYYVGVNFGAFLQGYGFEELDFQRVREGINDYLRAKGDDRSSGYHAQFRYSPDQMDETLSRYLALRSRRASIRNRLVGEDFLDRMAKQEGAVVTPSGLIYVVDEPGDSCRPVSVQDTVWLRFTGMLSDGTVFEEITAQEEPARYVLYRTIPGWQEGLCAVGQGGSIRLYVPSELAYGSVDPPYNVGPDQALEYHIHLSRVSHGR